MSDSVSVRQNEILKLLIQQGSVRAAELTELFQVTSETIRKDLNHLGELGYIERRHGGAVLSEAYRQEYVYSESKASFRRGEKSAIAQQALRYVEDHSVIYLDGGTTVCELSKLLGERTDLTVVTPSLLVADVFRKLKKHQLYLTGGLMNYDYDLLHIVENDSFIEQFRFAAAFFGSTGIRYHSGPTSQDYAEVVIRRKVFAQSESRILLCDSSKFRTGGVHQYADWSDLAHLITDSGAPEEQLATIRKHTDVVCVTAPALLSKRESSAGRNAEQ